MTKSQQPRQCIEIKILHVGWASSLPFRLIQGENDLSPDSLIFMAPDFQSPRHAGKVALRMLLWQFGSADLFSVFLNTFNQLGYNSLQSDIKSQDSTRQFRSAMWI
jgi:hypothetical protein